MLRLLLTLSLLCWSDCWAQQYHYPRPQLPFQLRPQQPGRYIVHTLGPHGQTYELQMQHAPAIYVAQQTYVVPGQQQQVPQQQQQQQHTTLHKNPLLINTNYQQQQHTPLGVPQVPQPATAANYYLPPQPLTIDTAIQAQPAAAAQPYAIVTLPNGQQVQDAGHGAGGPAPTASAHAHARVGAYHAQSQSASLDSYSYKQSNSGDARNYQRLVSNCPPNGPCQQQQLSPGQIDAAHQQLLQAARSHTVPHSENCQPNSQLSPGKRPRARRTQTQTQQQLAKYPYN
ncbi:putative uncharacterized protein DDB_G0271606 [Drosophila busckii]|uniref:putative uncharacterized protein DDB_G0271606 n=1 Tax=Drosophila busckii TaxID=30019 RepID=UPI00083EA686|nr:putative uncharacterized protein DDB_G0271606 [Drosophila busckii]